MKFSTSTLCLAISASSALLLAACGGGGGSDGRPPFTPSTVTSANAQDVSAQMLVASGVYTEQASAGNALLTGVSVSTPRTGLLRASLQQLYKGVQAKSTGNMVTGVEVSEPSDCTGGGTLFISGTFANKTTVTIGDRFSMTATNCVEGGITFNGGISYTFTSLTGTVDPNAAWSATMVMGYSQFSLEAGGEVIRANGDLTLIYDQTSSTVVTASASSGSLQVILVRQGATVGDYTFTNAVYNSTLNGGAYTDRFDFTVTGIIGKLGNTSFNVKTTVTFESTAGFYPTTGSMTITASDKTTVKMTAIGGNNVMLELDKNADGTIDETINTTWTALESRMI